MKEIDSIDLNIGQAYLTDWSVGMALRELIANAIDETSDGEVNIKKLSDVKWKIENKVSEIQPENFLINEGVKANKKGKIGKFGIGLKDSISVLMSNGIKVKFITSEYIFDAVYEVKSKIVKQKSINIKVMKSNSKFVGTQVILENCKDIYMDEAKQYFLKYRGEPSKVIKTIYGDILVENKKKYNGTIYFNGMKIASENTFLYSYNIKLEDKELKKGISRERNQVSKDVYMSSVKRIINSLEDEKDKDTLNKYFERIYKSRDGSLSGELIYKEIQIRIFKYLAYNKIRAIIFPVNKDSSMVTLYRQVSKNSIYKIIVLNDKYYKYVVDCLELVQANMIAGEYKIDYTIINTEELNEGQKESLEMIKAFIRDRIEINDVISVKIIKEDKPVYHEEINELMIPINGLGHIRKCLMEIIDVIPCSDRIKEIILESYIDDKLKAYKKIR
ncbi:MAG: hypothetical protein RR620_07805 [Clostridium sp.]